MKVVIAGGTGHVGTLLARAFHASGDELVVLSRKPGPAPWRVAAWDARTVGSWAAELGGAEAVVNLAGRSVNCRYTRDNRQAILDSRVESTRAVGEAIARAAQPPRVWLQMSTATIYAHRFDASNDEATGILGGAEADVPGPPSGSETRKALPIPGELSTWRAASGSSRRQAGRERREGLPRKGWRRRRSAARKVQDSGIREPSRAAPIPACAARRRLRTAGRRACWSSTCRRPRGGPTGWRAAEVRRGGRSRPQPRRGPGLQCPHRPRPADGTVIDAGSAPASDAPGTGHGIAGSRVRWTHGRVDRTRSPVSGRPFAGGPR